MTCSVEKIAEGKRIRILLSLPSPSLNDFSYSHWRVQHREKKKWLMLVFGALGSRRLECLALGKRRVTIERHGKQALDIDNLIGGAKCAITDNLRRFGLIVNDDPTQMQIEARNVKLTKGEKPHTVVIIEDID